MLPPDLTAIGCEKRPICHIYTVHTRPMALLTFPTGWFPDMRPQPVIGPALILERHYGLSRRRRRRHGQRGP